MAAKRVFRRPNHGDSGCAMIAHICLIPLALLGFVVLLLASIGIGSVMIHTQSRASAAFECEEAHCVNSTAETACLQALLEETKLPGYLVVAPFVSYFGGTFVAGATMSAAQEALKEGSLTTRNGTVVNCDEFVSVVTPIYYSMFSAVRTLVVLSIVFMIPLALTLLIVCDSLIPRWYDVPEPRRPAYWERSRMVAQ